MNLGSYMKAGFMLPVQINLFLLYRNRNRAWKPF